MDTVEHRYIYGVIYPANPILWKGKSAREVQQEMYPDHFLIAGPKPPGSLNPNVKHLRSYNVSPRSEKSLHRDPYQPLQQGQSRSVLVEID